MLSRLDVIVVYIAEINTTGVNKKLVVLHTNEIFLKELKKTCFISL